MTLNDQLRLIAGHLGMEEFFSPERIQAVFGAVNQAESRRLVEAGTISFPDHARRSSDGNGDCVSCCAKQHNDI